MSATQFLLSIHLVCIVAGFGIAVGNVINRRVAAGMSGEGAKALLALRIATLRYADVFIAGFLISGLLLLWQVGGMGNLNGWFKVKMLAVAIAIVSYGVTRMTVAQITRTGNMALAWRLKVTSPVTLAAGAVALVCAVLTFAN